MRWRAVRQARRSRRGAGPAPGAPRPQTPPGLQRRGSARRHAAVASYRRGGAYHARFQRRVSRGLPGRGRPEGLRIRGGLPARIPRRPAFQRRGGGLLHRARPALAAAAGFSSGPGGTRPMTTLTGHARLAGVMGWPVAHSRSPRLHGFWLAQHDIDGAYLPLPVHPANLAAALRALPLLGFAGANITLPHKAAALAMVDRASEEARRIGAINTVVVGADGLLEGSNTDGYGFLAHLKTSDPAWRADNKPAG